MEIQKYYLSNKSIEFEVVGAPRIVPTNAMYFAVPMKSKKNPSKMWATMARSPRLKEFQSSMKNFYKELLQNDASLSSTIDLLVNQVNSGHYGIYSVYKFCNINEDVSNCVKALEDTIISDLFNHRIDDKQVDYIALAKYNDLQNTQPKFTVHWTACPRSYDDSIRAKALYYCPQCKSHVQLTKDYQCVQCSYDFTKLWKDAKYCSICNTPLDSTKEYCTHCYHLINN